MPTAWGQVASEELLPAPLLALDNTFSHHVIVAEKLTHQLHLFRNDTGIPKLVKTYQMVTGKKSGDKFFQGDHRTPEGIYFLTQFIPRQELLRRHGKEGEIYGVGAFVMSYPNPMDNIEGKTGSGIWLHSTNDETRIEKGLDSRGCVVTANSNLIDISQYIELNKTSIVVVQELHYLAKTTWEQNRKQIMDTVEAWRVAWAAEKIDDYISHYHDHFKDPSKGNLNAYKQYKKAVFSAPGSPEVQLANLSVMHSGKYAVVTFQQNYRSNTINDIGRKSLFLKRDEYYNWKIVSEIWSKAGIEERDEHVAFVPSLRFFEDTNPEQVLSSAKGSN
jgi:murein L,D-transpeptidase YafK